MDHSPMQTIEEAADGAVISPPLAKNQIVFRHRLSTRLWHWVNVVAIFVMLMSGLMIFNAHPMLYWGHYAPISIRHG
jgi:Ni,Fe-hydrogenase I cytochrome b subunit